MALPANPSPREFGQALRAAREASGATLEHIAERTKIAARMLQALEEGRFEVLPGGIFPRAFVRQYVQLLREPPEPWLAALDAALQRAESESRPHDLVVTAEPEARRRVRPWLIGTFLVAAALAVLLLGYRGVGGRSGEPTPPTPETVLSVLTPAPEPTPTAVSAPSEATAPPLPTSPTALPSAVPPAAAGALVIRALARPCWVRVRPEGAEETSRLVAAGASWEIAAGGKDVEVVLGDAGAVEISYLGRQYTGLGRDGEVARVSLGPHAATPSPTP